MKTIVHLSPQGAANLKSAQIATLGRQLTPFKFPVYSHNTNSVHTDFLERMRTKSVEIRTEQASIRNTPLDKFRTIKLKTSKKTLKGALAAIGLTMRNAKHATIEQVA